KPLVASSSIDLVVSNCVLNLVNDTRKKQLFREIYRVLKHGGRAVISDIVADQDVPAELKKNDELWTGCISGALRRDRFLAAFAEAGFYGIQELSSSFWRSESGQHFHSVTVAAYKGKEGPCWETYRNAYYVGPFSAVEDDDGHRYERGQSVPVCEKTARILNREPYAGHFLVSEGLADESEQIHFDCSGNTRNGDISPAIRDAMNRSSGLASGPSECGPEGNCC
ncbi:MAG: methyltransferase domain-containing protein, partial [Planctomycetota bacterium]